MREFQSRHGSQKLLFICALAACLALAAWAAAGNLPARNWNLQNLQRLEKLPANHLTFAVLGDNRGNFPVFEALLKQMGSDPLIRFAIHLGDMVEKGELPRYRSFFESIRRYFKLPLLAVIGNHELAGDPGGRLYVEIFGPRYFSFHLGSHYFIILDDADIKTGLGEQQWRWLEGELAGAQTYQTRLVFLHVPLFDPRGGEHHHCLPPEPGRRLLTLFRKYRVTHIFAAHLHSYFEGLWDGVPYTITAGAGAPLYGADPRHFFYHYLKVSVKGEQVETQVRRLGKKEATSHDRP